MKKYLLAVSLLFATGLFGCSGSTTTVVIPPVRGTSTLLASGGTGSAGTGGQGGYLYVESSGKVRILKSGSVDASFVVSERTPSFGLTQAVVSGGTTTVLLDNDQPAGSLCIATGSSNLYIGGGDGTCGDNDDTLVTGLTVQAGATLVLVDQGSGNATANFTNDLVVNGTLAAEAGKNLFVDANLVLVGTAGDITTSATTTDSSGMELDLGTGSTGTIINHGIIEAKGMGSGNGGHIYMEADNLVANYGTIDASGGNSDTGSGGSCTQWYSLEVYVDYGNFYSSGTIRLNGGAGGGGTGGEAGQAWIETAYSNNDRGMNGDIILSGTLEAIGGNGDAGDGGGSGYLGFETDAMGKISANITMTDTGGSETGGTAGGSPLGIEFYSYNYDIDVATPGKISIGGNFDFRGGDGDQNGGTGGYLYVYCNDANNAYQGIDVDLVGFPVLKLNGGDGATGGDASNLFSYPAAGIYTNSPDVSVAPGAIINQAIIEAKGGNSTAGGTGGLGGYIEMYYHSGTPDATTTITNSGTIDVSGGTGDTGGDTFAYANGGNSNGYHSIDLDAWYVDNAGSIIANGGNGTSQGGGGGDIWLNSENMPTTRGTLSAAGGAPNGSAGNIFIDGTQL